jgi:hypothetical protein
MKTIIRFIALASVVVLCACESNNTKTPVFARVVEVDDVARMEIKSAVAKLLYQDDVLLAQDAFVDSSVLVLERPPHKDAQQNRMQGRELQMPEKITLQRIAGDCVLKRLSNDEIVKLQQVKCVAE